MEKYLNSPIRDLIEQFPATGLLLEERGIGCVPCEVASCLLKDVVHVHGMSEGEAAALLARIEQILYPERDVRIPEAPPAPTGKTELHYSPPIRLLVEEHKLIKRVLALIPGIVRHFQTASEVDLSPVPIIVDFIRQYADGFHHMKEEDVLFSYVGKDEEIIQVMYREHEQGRGFVRAMEQDAEAGEVSKVCRNMLDYRDLLLDHIRKEDEILYPYIDRSLSTRAVGVMSETFRHLENEHNRRLGWDVSGKYLQIVEQLENRFEQRS